MTRSRPSPCSRPPRARPRARRSRVAPGSSLYASRRPRAPSRRSAPRVMLGTPRTPNPRRASMPPPPRSPGPSAPRQQHRARRRPRLSFHLHGRGRPSGPRRRAPARCGRPTVRYRSGHCLSSRWARRRATGAPRLLWRRGRRCASSSLVLMRTCGAAMSCVPVLALAGPPSES